MQQSLFLNSMVKQDPMFSETLFSKGFETYDWNEKEKIANLGQDRFKLVINDLDPLINFDVAQSQSIQMKTVLRSHYGHCPWTPRCQVNKQNQEQSLQF